MYFSWFMVIYFPLGSISFLLCNSVSICTNKVVSWRYYLYGSSLIKITSQYVTQLSQIILYWQNIKQTTFKIESHTSEGWLSFILIFLLKNWLRSWLWLSLKERSHMGVALYHGRKKKTPNTIVRFFNLFFIWLWTLWFTVLLILGFFAFNNFTLYTPTEYCILLPLSQSLFEDLLLWDVHAKLQPIKKLFLGFWYLGPIYRPLLCFLISHTWEHSLPTLFLLTDFSQ